MEYLAPKSKCNLCDKEYSRTGLTRHIQSCINRKTIDDQKEDHLYIIVSALNQPDYFFHLLIPPATMLKDLDTFLRDKWLECCGHLSAFSYQQWGEEIPMSRKIHQIVGAGEALFYQYDFGSTTELTIRGIGYFPRIGNKNGKSTYYHEIPSR